MQEFDELNLKPDEFKGIARLFPLPNAVLFPHVMQPLHIFEPRYRSMVEDAMSSDRAIAIASFEPGWEEHYEGRPPLKPTACLGHIAACQEMDDGRYNILLLGRQRVSILEELPPLRQFREARALLVEDEYPTQGDDERPQRQRELVDAFRQVLPSVPEVLNQLDELLARSVPLGMLTDIFAYTVEMSIDIKHRLLSETNVDKRATELLKKLAELEASGENGVAGQVQFPPQFSVN